MVVIKRVDCMFSLTLFLLNNFEYFFLLSADFFKANFFQTPSECQLNSLDPDQA